MMIDPIEIAASRPRPHAFRLNGREITVTASPTERLLRVLRDDLLLTGTKRSCEIGRCGACMTLVDGKPVNACLAMVYQIEGKAVTTIEGVAGESPDRLHPVQAAFLEEGGYQCGYCTPGMIVAATALLADNADPSDAEIEEALSGNLCRCTGYGGILRAMRRAIAMMKGAGGDA